MNKIAYINLIKKHGTLKQFTEALNLAYFDGFIKFDEYHNAIEKYRIELNEGKMQNFELDQQWLKQQRPQATEEQLEAFADKVAFIICDCPSVEVKTIRENVLKTMGL